MENLTPLLFVIGFIAGVYFAQKNINRRYIGYRRLKNKEQSQAIERELDDVYNRFTKAQKPKQ